MQQRAGSLRIARGEQPSALVGQPLELPQVQLARLDPQQVPRLAEDQPVGLATRGQQPAQPGGLPLQAVAGGLGRRRPPHGLEQPLGGHHPVGVQRQHADHAAQAGPRQRHLPLVDAQLDRAEHAQLHRPTPVPADAPRIPGVRDSGPILWQPWKPIARADGPSAKCGFTNGQFGWHPGSPQTVDVQGTAADHPLPGEPRNSACGGGVWYPDDGYSTDVTFTAYAGGSQVGSVSASRNNGERTFPSGFALHASGPIERVTVQVCRFSHGPPACPLAPSATAGRSRRTSRPSPRAADPPLAVGGPARCEAACDEARAGLSLLLGRPAERVHPVRIRARAGGAATGRGRSPPRAPASRLPSRTIAGTRPTASAI